ncbi:MAG TPA: hypothetical protein PKV98_04090 [Burkholderiaceae bacterium]|nr:hypothetical protein [Burkholderiaceae bacterium]
MSALEGVEELLRSVKYAIVPYTRGTGIDIGVGPRKAYARIAAVRERGDKTMPPNMAPELWCDSFDDIDKDIKDDSLDFIFAWGEKSEVAIEASRILKAGGHIVRAPSYDEMTVCRKGADGMLERVDWWYRPDQKTACVVRYGAIGDQLQAASVLPELKRQGYHITWMCEPLGESLLKNDPHVDAIIVQDKDQVPNQELPHYWNYWRTRFDKWVNLCESVEGSLIKLPGRRDYEYPDAMRRRLCDENYLEFMAEMAELPFHPEHLFYPTEGEDAAAALVIDEIADASNKGWTIGQRWDKPYVVMWALSGSSVHKVYPHMDAVMAKILMEIPNAHIITVGDEVSALLEAGWENEPRVHRMCGKLELRDTLALAQRCDMVIGPETGVLNAVAFEPSAKIVFLSHSSAKNLTRDWVNTEALHTKVTPCYPCHRLHNSHQHCPEHKESGTAMCQWELDPADVWDAVARAHTAATAVRKMMEHA